jgi:uncharacterized membrane protein
MRWVLALFYLIAGIVHLRSPDAFLPIMPTWVPLPREVVLLTGAIEIACAVALLVPRLRRWAAILLAAYAVAVFPANIKHAVDQVELPGLPSTWWYHGPRFVLQPILVWWALFCGAVIDWPFGRSDRTGSATKG